MQLFDKLILTNFIDFFSCAYTFCIYNYHKSQPFCQNFFSIENSLSQTFENLNFVWCMISVCDLGDKSPATILLHNAKRPKSCLSTYNVAKKQHKGEIILLPDNSFTLLLFSWSANLRDFSNKVEEDRKLMNSTVDWSLMNVIFCRWWIVLLRGFSLSGSSGANRARLWPRVRSEVWRKWRVHGV